MSALLLLNRIYVANSVLYKFIIACLSFSFEFTAVQGYIQGNVAHLGLLQPVNPRSVVQMLLGKPVNNQFQWTADQNRKIFR